MYDVSPLSAISGLSSISSLIFLPSHLAFSVLSFFCQWSIVMTFFPDSSLISVYELGFFCMALVEQLGDVSR